MIGSLMVYGHQQWSPQGLESLDIDQLTYLYHCVALVKKRENEAATEARKKAEEEAEELRRRRGFVHER